MQRIAVPMIVGMISSTVLTLIVIPAVYALIKERGLPKAIEAGTVNKILASSRSEALKARRASDASRKAAE